MLLLSPILLLFAALLIPTTSPHLFLSQRNTISPSDLHPSYGYIILSSGLARFILASRLSEDSRVSILVWKLVRQGTIRRTVHESVLLL
ncbi:hypothetical protein BDQ17DRAFT_1376967, partial [Cyathus striatus]